jgi:ATP-dependent DNA helicase RecQ
MTYLSDRALELLRLGSGHPTATFREGQEHAIRHILDGRGRLLVVQKTGWGKSFVYFIATKLLREQGAGPALLVSPLLALMRNQMAAAERMGVRARTINSDNLDDWAAVEAAVKRDHVDILLISPERLTNERFRAQVLARIASRLALVVIDEAHCISDWGHDFRPHYRLIAHIVRNLPPNIRLLATTATANNRVMADLQDVLGPDLTISRGDLHRPSLLLQTIRLRTQAERLAWLAEHVPVLSGHGIIYTLTVRDATQVADWLRSRGLNVESYTSETGDRRSELEQGLLDNKVKALVATTALGMGFDKPDLSFVIHYQAPGSVVAYYQQVGRAGRSLEAAYGVLLSGEEETEINNYFIESAFPTHQHVDSLLSALEDEPGGLSVAKLLGLTNISRGRIEKTLALLSIESPPPAVKRGTKWWLTGAALGDAFWERAERLTRLRREEQAQMQRYVALNDGHMPFLIHALDGELGDLRKPALPRLAATPHASMVREAATFLREVDEERDRAAYTSRRAPSLRPFAM